MKKAVESQKPEVKAEPKPDGDTTDLKPEADNGAKNKDDEKSENGDSVKSQDLYLKDKEDV